MLTNYIDQNQSSLYKCFYFLRILEFDQNPKLSFTVYIITNNDQNQDS